MRVEDIPIIRKNPGLRMRTLDSILRAAAALTLALLALVCPSAAHAGPGDANADSIYLVGEFVDPVCLFQHNMHGATAKQCALVRGRIEQGMGFLDIRRGRFYTVVGQNHWQDARQGFLGALGETLAIKARVWRNAGAAAIVVNAVYPLDRQPAAVYRWWPWHLEWSVALGCAMLAALYLVALARARTRPEHNRRPEPWRAPLFLASLVVVMISLNGPLHDLSDLYLFSTHMIQHLLLALFFPPMLILGLPPSLALRITSHAAVRPLWRPVSAMPVGFVLYTIVFSMWHLPSLYDLMMRQHGIHIAMHLMLMASAVLMWWPLLGGEAVGRRMGPGAQILYLFVLSLPMLPVAALITLADHPLYVWYALAPRVLPISALEDQRLGGLIMWVPGTLFWWVMITVVFFRRLARDSRPDESLAEGTV
ncbi:MAG: cytochrome c oxidase assembly protein [Candidatus Eisenbacteria bacterium]|nr:cytochrome c oxidase assembly protein [Candidatus Eisenbacteria bacterium]